MSRQNHFYRADTSAARERLGEILQRAEEDAEHAFVAVDHQLRQIRLSAAGQLREMQRQMEATSAVAENSSVEAIETMAEAARRLSSTVQAPSIELPDWDDFGPDNARSR